MDFSVGARQAVVAYKFAYILDIAALINRLFRPMIAAALRGETADIIQVTILSAAKVGAGNRLPICPNYCS